MDHSGKVKGGKMGNNDDGSVDKASMAREMVTKDSG